VPVIFHIPSTTSRWWNQKLGCRLAALRSWDLDFSSVSRKDG